MAVKKIRRDWLIQSGSAAALYCIPCLLFSHELTKPSRSALNSKDRFKLAHIKWQIMYNKFPEHETNMPHKQCCVKWKSLQHSLLAATGVDGHLQRQLLAEIEKNRLILQRLLHVTLHLASRNLAFRGKNANLEVHNEPILHEHLEK